MKTLLSIIILSIAGFFIVSCKTMDTALESAIESGLNTYHEQANSNQEQSGLNKYPPKIISFEADPAFIPPGTPYTLSWQTSNATDVHISGIGKVSPSGSHLLSNSGLEKEKIILTASNNGGFPPATKQLAMEIVMFSTKTPGTSIPTDTPVLAIGDRSTLRNQYKIYNVQTIKKLNPTTAQVYTPPKTSMQTSRLQGTYTIQQKSNRRYLDAHEGSNDNSVVTRNRQNNDTQRWIINPLGHNTYTIQQKSNRQYMDAHEGSNDNSVVTRNKQNNDTQRWIINPLGHNTYTIQQKSNRQYMDAHEGSNDNSVVTRNRQNNDTQRWIINPL